MAEYNAAPTVLRRVCRRTGNLSTAADGYLNKLCMGVEDLFHHVLAVLHDPAYRETNAGALRGHYLGMEWPRIPLPGWLEGDAPGASEELAISAERGRELARLLDSETPLAGLGNPGSRPHHRDTATGDSIYRRSGHH